MARGIFTDSFVVPKGSACWGHEAAANQGPDPQTRDPRSHYRFWRVGLCILLVAPLWWPAWAMARLFLSVPLFPLGPPQI
jgi:hypothetical protein